MRDANGDHDPAGPAPEDGGRVRFLDAGYVHVGRLPGSMYTRYLAYRLGLWSGRRDRAPLWLGPDSGCLRLGADEPIRGTVTISTSFPP